MLLLGGTFVFVSRAETPYRLDVASLSLRSHSGSKTVGKAAVWRAKVWGRVVKARLPKPVNSVWVVGGVAEHGLSLLQAPVPVDRRASCPGSSHGLLSQARACGKVSIGPVIDSTLPAPSRQAPATLAASWERTAGGGGAEGSKGHQGPYN